MQLGQRIARRMKELGLTQMQLAKRSGIRQQTISQYIRGKFKPGFDAIFALSKALWVDPGWFFQTGEPATPVSPSPITAVRPIASPYSADVIAFPVEVKPGYEAIAIIDKENQTLSLYQYDISRASHERLVLLAARSFRYDRMLEDYNTAQPRPEEIKRLVMQSFMNPPGSAVPSDATADQDEDK